MDKRKPRLHDETLNDWQRRDTWTASLGATLPLQEGASYERRRPTGKAELVADVAVPLAQACVTALVGALVGGIVAGIQGAAIGAAVAFGISWLVLLQAHRSLLWTFESATGRDVDRDGAIGGANAPIVTPITQPSTVKVELHERRQAGHRMRFVDLPIDDAKLTQVARAILHDGVNFSRPGLSGVLSQTEYARLSRAMLDAGLLVAVGGNKRVLSAAGRSLLRSVNTRNS